MLAWSSNEPVLPDRHPQLGRRRKGLRGYCLIGQYKRILLCPEKSQRIRRKIKRKPQKAEPPQKPKFLRGAGEEREFGLRAASAVQPSVFLYPGFSQILVRPARRPGGCPNHFRESCAKQAHRDLLNPPKLPPNPTLELPGPLPFHTQGFPEISRCPHLFSLKWGWDFIYI